MHRTLAASIASLLLVLAGGAALAADGQMPDRTPYYVPGTPTSNDLRRVPVSPGYQAPAGSIVITNARLIDGRGPAPRMATIVIERDRITKLLPAGISKAEWPKDAQLIDAKGKTVMPGLIDLHTHITYVMDFGAAPEPFNENQADAALRAVDRLRYYIESGITSVRDVGSHGHAPFLLKNRINDGKLVGPRIFAAGQLIAGTGGHATEDYIWRTAPAYPDSSVREAEGPDDWRTAVRTNFKRGADLIKLSSHYTQDEINAAVDEAHRLGLRVTVDSETIFTDMAVKAGVDSIEHPLPRSDEAIRQMAAKRIASVPTFVPYQLINQSGGYVGSTSRRFSITDDTMFATVRKMKDAGVKLGIGTDLILDWYQNLPNVYVQELHNFERLGYTPAQVLSIATRVNSEILGMDDRLGTIEPGKLADILIVDGQPDQRLDDLKNVDTVIVNGRLSVRDGHIFMPRHESKAAGGAINR